MEPDLSALVFDAYGTLFDVTSVAADCEVRWPGFGGEVSTLWRAKQLEWTWQRGLMQRYTSFREVTADALRYAAASFDLPCDPITVERLLGAYLRLPPYPEVPRILKRLRPRSLAILSNGSPDMLNPLVANSGIDRLLDHVISVDELGTYKPDPAVYQLAADRLGLAASEIGFVSANCWDACGAKAFGYHVFWINRTGASLDALGAVPDRVISSVGDLLPG